MINIRHLLKHFVPGRGFLKDGITALLSLCIIGVLYLITFNITFLNPIAKALNGFTTTDVYYGILGETEPETSPIITIVDVTSLYSRDSIATVLEEVADLEPAVMDVDIVFERPHEDAADAHLAIAASEMDNAIFSYKLLGYDHEKGEYTHIAHSFFAKEMNLHEGFVNGARTMIRDIPLWEQVGDKRCPSVVAQMAHLWNQQPLQLSGPQTCPISYEPTIFPVVPWDSLQEHEDLIRSHIVIVGGVKESVDVCYTPLGQMHGIEVLAYGIKSLLEAKKTIVISGWLYWLLTVLLVMIAAYLSRLYSIYVGRCKNLLLHSILTSSLVAAIRTFCLMLIVVFLGFHLFVDYHINMDLTITLSCIAVMPSAKELRQVIFLSIQIFKRRIQASKKQQ